MTIRWCDHAEDAWGQGNSGSSREEAAEQQSPSGLEQGGCHDSYVIWPGRGCLGTEEQWKQQEEAAEQQSPAGLKQGQKGNSELRESRRVSILAAKTKEQKT